MTRKLSLRIYSFVRGLKYKLFHGRTEVGITTNLSIDEEKDYPHSFIKEENAPEVPKSLTYLPTIALQTEKSIQKHGKKIGLLSEIQTGYPEFDKNVSLIIMPALPPALSFFIKCCRNKYAVSLVLIGKFS